MKKPIGIELKMSKGSKLAYIKLSEEERESFKELFGGKTYLDYLSEFIGGESNYAIADNALKKAMHDSLAPNVSKKCLYCNGKSNDEADKGCAMYYLQMQVTYLVAGNEFVNIVMANKHIYNDKVALQQLTINFFDSLSFIKNHGKMYLDLEKLCRYALNANFEAIGKKFSESETLKTLTIINDTIDKLDKADLQNKVLQTEDENYIDLQKQFFEQKQKYYKEKFFLEKEKPLVHKGRRIKNNISVSKIVLYYYYLQSVGKFPYFENHPQGKVKAIEELLVKDKIKTTLKHFQIKYNLINNHNTNRVAKNQVANIEYVANTMLKDYPEAKELALSELKLAQSKER
jgi:hypothetical protein